MRLRNYDFCPTLAETKPENIILDHMNSRICLGSLRFWLHEFDQITTKRDHFSHILHQQSAPVIDTIELVVFGRNRVERGANQLNLE